jgi:uncharacterized protein (UPF0332 family)
MTPEDKATYVKYRLATAGEFLADATLLLGNNSLKSASNRIYYAMFQAVSAAALQMGFVTKSHSQLKGWFDKTLVKTGVIDKELGKAYGHAFDLRTSGDYKDLPNLDPADLANLNKQAGVLLSKIERLIAPQP